MIYLIGTYLFACRKLQAFSKKQDFSKKQAFSMTPILIESQNPVLKITFSHRTGKNWDSTIFQAKYILDSEFVTHSARFFSTNTHVGNHAF